MNWTGVLPAITTPFDENLRVDHAFLAQHVQRLLQAGCNGIVALGSLGEGATLDARERRDVLTTLVKASRAPVVAGIPALSTIEAVALARDAEALGCAALMVLPPYVYQGDWRETRAHAEAVLRATRLPTMLYNNPVAYGTDFLPEQIAELARAHTNLEAVKESSTDARRVTALRALCGERLAILAGVDDCVLEGLAMGAVGWVAGVTNALPEPTLEMFAAARAGNWARAQELNAWLLPLLRMDTVPKFVQLIKLLQQECGLGSERVRPPRLEVTGSEREAALAAMRAVQASAPAARVQAVR